VRKLKDEPLKFVYLPSGRRIGFVRGSDAVAHAVISDMREHDDRLGKQGYLLRRVPAQRPPGKAKPKRKAK
jgi:hypothetical protein